MGPPTRTRAARWCARTRSPVGVPSRAGTSRSRRCSPPARPQVAESRFAGHDKYRIATVCEGRAQSLAEIAAYTRMPLGVARVLVADMVADGLLTLHMPLPPRGSRSGWNCLEGC